jgi:two-component system, OmpR family, sensor histidine kinase MprB
MNLRLRLTLVVAVTFALVVIGCTYAAHVSTSRQLRTETDAFLVQRADRFTRASPAGFPQGPQRPGGEPDGREGPALADPDALTQILTSDGAVASYITGQPALPVDATDKAIARQGGDAHFRNVHLDGNSYRVLTVALPGGGAAQVARSVEEADELLDSLDTRLRLIALAGTLVAATLAWLIARRTVRPIEELTKRTALVATTKEFDHPIAVSRRDEIGRLAASFNRMLDELRMSREQQRRLVMDASHELRTPLTALRTNVDLLRRARSFDQAQRDELLLATDVELRELTDLVSELVELATDTRSEEAVQPVDLGELVDRVATRQQRRTGRAVIVQKDEPGVVDGRITLLERAVSNLVDNALKFSPAGSTVDVVARDATVEVLDRGSGIPAEDLPHVFDRFYRATSARQVQGSGLGLAIAEQIAELHSGTVTLAARPGGGIVARLTLPAADGAAPQTPDGRSHAPGATPSN